MSRVLKKRIALSDTVMGWIVAAIGLIAAFMFDTKEQPQKWHAAIMWTGCTFGGVVIIRRDKWMSWRFWLSWAVCVVVHVFAMWLIFAKVLASLRVVGTLYMVPLALVELIFLQRIMAKMERRLEGPPKQQEKLVRH
jgi:hypothetical protein